MGKNDLTQQQNSSASRDLVVPCAIVLAQIRNRSVHHAGQFCEGACLFWYCNSPRHRAHRLGLPALPLLLLHSHPLPNPLSLHPYREIATAVRCQRPHSRRPPRSPASAAAAEPDASLCLQQPPPPPSLLPNLMRSCRCRRFFHRSSSRGSTARSAG